MSTEINITIGDQRLLQESKTRAAANQQSLDSRLEEQQLAEQLTEAVDEATPEDPRSDAFSLQLDRRPAAQRRVKEEEEEEFDEEGNLKVRYIGLFKPIRTDNVRAASVTWDTIRVARDDTITTRRVYDGGTNDYRVADIIFRPTFDFWRGGSIVADSVSAPPVFALNNVERLFWRFKDVGFYYPEGISPGSIIPTYLSAPVGTFPFDFRELQALEGRIWTLASSTPSHVYYSYAYVGVKAASSVVEDIETILNLPDNEFNSFYRRTYTIDRVFNTRAGALESTECGYIKMDKRTGKIDFRQSTSPGFDPGFFVDNLYEEDPHYAVAQRSSGGTRNYGITVLNPVPRWPSNVQYNPETGVVIFIVRPFRDDGGLREVYQRTFPKNFTSFEMYITLIDYIPYDARTLRAGNFQLIGTVNKYDPFGEIYNEIFPLIFR